MLQQQELRPCDLGCLSGSAITSVWPLGTFPRPFAPDFLQQDSNQLLAGWFVRRTWGISCKVRGALHALRRGCKYDDGQGPQIPRRRYPGGIWLHGSGESWCE